MCLNNEFSRFTHKTVYLSFVVGKENPLSAALANDHHSVMTFMESTADEIHESLEDAIESQTHFRLVRLVSWMSAKFHAPDKSLIFCDSSNFRMRHKDVAMRKIWVNACFGGHWRKHLLFSPLVCRRCSFYGISLMNQKLRVDQSWWNGSHATATRADLTYDREK